MASVPPSPERIPDQRTERRKLLVMLAAALVPRVAVGSFIDASGFDTDLMQSWTRTLLNAPLSEFYAEAEGPDHLPGDLWFLWAIGHGLEALGLDNAPRGPFVAPMKLVPAIADVVIGWELFVLVRWFATSRVALAVAGAFAFNPASIFLTSIWGQWDAVSASMLLGGVLVILRTVSSPVGSAENGVPPHACHADQREASPREALGGEADVHRALADWGPHLRPASPGDPSSLRSLGMTAGEGGDTWKQSQGQEGSSPRSLRPGAGMTVDGEDNEGETGRSTWGKVGHERVPRTVLSWPVAVPLFTWAVLIKPPLALVAGVFVLYACVCTALDAPSVRDAVGRLVIAIAASLALGIATASLIILPFDVGLPGMSTRWMVLERARYALDLYPFTTLQAANIWMMKDAHLYRPSDTDGTLLGLTERTWGSLLLAFALVWIVALVVARWRRAPEVTLVAWAALASSYAIFMLPTRVHERYFFPVMVLALALSGLPTIFGPRESAVPDVPGSWFARLRRGPGQDRWTWVLACTISAVFLVSLLLAYDHTVTAIRAALFDVPLAFLFRSLAVVNLGVFLVTMLLPLWWRHTANRSR